MTTTFASVLTSLPPSAFCLLSLSACCLEPEPEWSDCEAFGDCYQPASCAETACPIGFRCGEYEFICAPDPWSQWGQGGSGQAGHDGTGATSMPAAGGGGATSAGGAGGSSVGGNAGTSVPSCSGCEVPNIKPPAPVVPLCQFNHECGTTGRCFDGACQAACTSASACGTGDVCLKGFCQVNPTGNTACVFDAQCSGGSCINGTCHSACTTTCSNRADTCDQGICKPNQNATPQCTRSAQCSGGNMCVNGACRTECWDSRSCGAGTSGTVCMMRYCVAPQEITPQCETNKQCTGGTSCVNALCCTPA